MRKINAKERAERIAGEQLRDDLHRFVDEIVRYGDSPSQWPMTQPEQVAFVRKVIFQARKLQQSESYKRESIAIAAENLAFTS